MKCENSDKIIEEFCGLRSKCYAFRCTSEDTEKLNAGDKGKLVRYKGTTKVVIHMKLIQ